MAFLASTAAANATAHIHINLSSQTMHVDSSSGRYSWPVSTARSGYYTPRGSFAPRGLQRMHYSKKYHNSPMPHSIFFRGGYAIHGSYSTGMLGRPASHGCVRLSPGNAATLYHIVQREGGRISITGSPPGGSARYAAAHKRRHMAKAGGGKFELRYANLRAPYRGDRGPGAGRRHAFRGARGWEPYTVAPVYNYPRAY